MLTFPVPLFQGKIAKDARECAQECVSEFISFITSEASDRCQVNFVFLFEKSSSIHQHDNTTVRHFQPNYEIYNFVIQQAEKRKTINGEDILFAMSTLGFDNYVEPLKLYLQKYREATKGDKQGTEGFEDLGEDVLCKYFMIFEQISNQTSHTSDK